MLKSLLLLGAIFFATAPAASRSSTRAARGVIDLEDKLFYGFNVTAGKSLLDQDALQTTFPIIDPNSSYKDHIVKVTGSTEQKSMNFSSYSVRSLVDEYSSSIGASLFGKVYAVDFDIAGTFDLSKSISNTFSKYFELYTTYINRFYYVVQLDVQDIRNYLATNFNNELNAVSSVADAKNLFARYGTHLNTGYMFGGRMDITNYKTTSEYSNNFAHSLTLKEKVSATIGIINSGNSASIAQNYGTSENTTQSTSTYNFKSYGGVATSSLTLDGLFTYNESIIDGEKAGFMYTRWVNSINDNKDLTIIGIPNGAQSIPLWNLLPSNAASNAKRQFLMDAYVEMCGDKYDEYCNKYKELARSVDYNPDSQNGVSTSSVFLKTKNGFFYEINPSDLLNGGDHYQVHKGDTLYFNLNSEDKSLLKTFKVDSANSFGYKTISEKDNIYQVDADNGKFVINLVNKINGSTYSLVSAPITSCNYEGGLGTEKYPYIIADTQQFQKITSSPSSNYILVNDLNFNGMQYVPMNDFSGTLEGNYCSIKNLKIDSGSSWGLFKKNSGTIKNLKIENAGSSTTYDDFKVGGVDYRNDKEKAGFITNSISANDAGIICGVNTGSIENVYLRNIFVRNIIKDNLAEDASRTMNVGSVCGINSGTISNVLVADSTILNASLTNEVQGVLLYLHTGGIVGYNNGGTIQSCVYDTNSYGSIFGLILNSFAGLVSKPVADLELFTGGLAGYVKGNSVIRNCYTHIKDNSAVDISCKTNTNKETKKYFGIRSAMFVAADDVSLSKTNLFTNGVSNLPYYGVQKNEAGFDSSTSLNPAVYKAIENCGETISLTNSAMFDQIGLNEDYFSYDGAASLTSKIKHIFFGTKSSFMNVILNPESQSFNTNFYSGNVFSPSNIDVLRYVGKTISETIKVFRIEVTSNGTDLLFDVMNNASNTYLASISLYGANSENVFAVSNSKLNVQDNELVKIYVDDSEDYEINEFAVEEYIENFNFNDIKLKGILSNGETIDINSDTTILKNAVLSLNTTDIQVGDNIIKVTYGNASKKLTAEFLLKVSKREISKLKISKDPNTVIYNEGSKFNPSGMEITVTFDDETEKVITDMSKFEFTGDVINTGDNEIVVSYTDYTHVARLNVTGKETPRVVPESVSLNVTSQTINVGDSFILISTILPENAANKNVIWSSSNESVASVTNGVVAGLQPGQSIITVSTVDGGKTASCIVTVASQIEETVPVKSVTLSDTSLTLHLGEVKSLIATITPANATNKNVSWISTNTNVVTVENGQLHAVAEGNAVIFVTTADGGKTALCNVSVVKGSAEVVDIVVSGQKLIFDVNDEFTLGNGVVKAILSDGGYLDVTSVAVLSDPDMSTEGTKTINVSYGNKNTSYEIVVQKKSDNNNDTEQENEGIPWWGILLIVIGSIIVLAIIIFVISAIVG